MSQLRNATVLLSLALLASCGKQDESEALKNADLPGRTEASNPDDSEPPVVVVESSDGTHIELKDNSVSAGAKEPAVPSSDSSWSSFLDSGLDAAEGLANDASELGNEALELGGELGKDALEFGQKVGEDALEIAGDVAQVAVDGAYVVVESIEDLEQMGDEGLAALGFSAGTRDSIITFGKRKIPGIKDLDRYKTARELHAEGLACEDSSKRDEKVHQARRLCLHACISAGLDLGTLGSAGVIDSTLEGVDRGFTVIEKTKTASNLSGVEDLNQLARGLDLILAYPSVAHSMDYLLTMELPEKSESEEKTDTTEKSPAKGAQNSKASNQL